jgi:hypothetical protein
METTKHIADLAVVLSLTAIALAPLLFGSYRLARKGRSPKRLRSALPQGRKEATS